MYKRIPVTKLTGLEKFKNTGEKTFSVQEFWSYGFSGLNSNVLRGALAEFLVENALKENAEIEVRNPWGDYDVLFNGKKIEVKCCSYIQDWDQERLSTIKWSGLKAKDLYWSTAVNGAYVDKEADYKSDIYVLALFKHQDPDTLDILDLDQWCFYVLSREQLKEISGNRSSVSLALLKKSNIEPVPFGKMHDKIGNIADGKDVTA